MRSRITLPSVLLLAFALCPVATAQEPEPSPQASESFPAEVEVVVVDAVVLDEDGNAVAGLSADDFALKEEGRLQTISSFDAIQVPAAPPEPEPRWQALEARARPARRVTTNFGPTRATGRSFVVVFDDVHLSPQNAEYARRAVTQFLEQAVREGDVVTLISTDGSVWWNAEMLEGQQELLGLVDRLNGRYIRDLDREYISDYEALRIWIYRDSLMERRVERRYIKFGVLDDEYVLAEEDRKTGGQGTYIASRASEYYRQAMARNKLTLGVVERALEAQTLTRGRKSLILVSDGFIFDPELPDFKQVTQTALEANVAIYFVSARGLSGLPDQFTALFQRGSDENFMDLQDAGYAFFDVEQEYGGSETLASQTGGFTIKNTNDLGGGLERIADESQNYYLLGYRSTDPARDGKFREIEVEVKRKGLKVRARKGYYAPGGDADARRPEPAEDADVQVALDSPFALPEIPLSMSAYVFEETLLDKARVTVVADVDISDLAFEQQEDRSVDAIEYLLAVINRETGEHFRYDERVDMRLLPTTRAAYETTGYPIVREFDLPVARYQAKLVVRDANSGTLGSVTHDFEVGDLARLRVSTPVLTDSLEPRAPGQELSARPAASRTFWAGELLYCQFFVYGARKDVTTGQPQVKAGHAVLDAQGKTLFAAEPTPIQPTSLGSLSRLIGLSTQGLPPGDYVLRLQLEDSLAGAPLELDEAFSLKAPGEPKMPAAR